VQTEYRVILEGGMGMSAPRKYWSLANNIGTELLKAGIGPMMGLIAETSAGDPIRIFIGDVRTASLPPPEHKPLK
jgi:hypothetical protein